MDIKEATERISDTAFVSDICAQAKGEMVALLDGELMPTEAAVVETHIASCPHCAAYRNELQSTLRLTNSLPTPEPIDVVDTILRYIAGETPESRVKETARLSPTEIARARAKAENVSFIDLKRHAPALDAIATISGDVARKYRAIPVRRDGQTLFVAMANPRDINAIDHVKMATPRYFIRPMLAEPDILDAAIDRAYPPTAPLQLSDTQVLLAGMQALQSELAAMRTEMADLRRQLTAVRGRLQIAPSRPNAADRFTPYAPSSQRERD